MRGARGIRKRVPHPESIVNMNIYSPAWLKANVPRSRINSPRRGLWRLFLRFLALAGNRSLQSALSGSDGETPSPPAQRFPV